MHNACSFPREPVTAGGHALYAAWDVDVRADYDVSGERSRQDSHARSSRAGANLVALRTHSGAGRVHLATGEAHETVAGSLLVFDFKQLRRYHTVGSRWRFWWFEFAALEPLRISWQRLLHPPIKRREMGDCEQIFRLLRREALPSRCLAVAEFVALLYRWWEDARAEAAPVTPGTAIVSAIVEKMYAHLGERWSVASMAEAAGMSASQFRKVFREATGKSPKQVFDEIRLAYAYERLRLGHRTITEVSDELGYCDPFHFSKVFKRRFGVSPSRTAIFADRVILPVRGPS